MTVLPTLVPQIAVEFSKKLHEARGKLEGRSQDLLILVFSRWGTEIDGRRYLVMANAETIGSIDAEGDCTIVRNRAIGRNNGQSVPWGEKYRMES